MKKAILSLAALLGSLLLGAGAAPAQVFTPTYMSPVTLNDIGVYISDGTGDLAVEGIWRGGPLGLRVGFVDAGDDLLSVGGELRSPIGLANAPLSLAFTAGAQGLIGDVDAVGLQAGLSAGHRFLTPGLALTPYIHPRIALINGFLPDDDFEAEVLADVGLDVEFSPSLVFRFNAAISDESPGFGVGLAIRR